MTSSPPLPSISNVEAEQNGTPLTRLGNHYAHISASGQARQHNGNVYNTSTNYYTIRQRRSDETLRESDLNKRFLKAAAEGQTRRVDYLHHLGADLDYKDEFEMTALHHACFNGFEDTVETLLQMGSDVNAHSNIYGTPLCLAAIRRRKNVVDVLINGRANIHADGGLIGSPLHSACRAGDVDITDKLFTLGCPVSIDRLCSGQIMNNAINGQLTTDFQDMWCLKGQPLHAVADRQASVATLDFLLRNGANVDAPSKSWQISKREDLLQDGGTVESTFEGITALMAAVNNYNAAGVLKLLNAGANPDLQTSYGWTAMMYGGRRGRTDSLSALIQRGTDVNVKNIEGYTPAIWAAAKGFDKVLRLLIQAGATLDATNNKDMSALSKAAANGHTKCIKALLAAPTRVDLDARDQNEYGRTASHWAAKNGHSESLEALLDGGAPIETRTVKDGATALTLAAQYGRLECVNTLIQKGANVAAADRSNNTPLHFAAFSGHLDVGKPSSRPLLL